MKIKIRKTWGELRPYTRVRGSKKIYNRNKDKFDWRKSLD